MRRWRFATTTLSRSSRPRQPTTRSSSTSPPWAKKKRLDLDTLLLACAALPVTVVERSDYQQKLATARRRIGRRDPDDVDVLALALTLNLPVWSNDNDFEDSGVEWHTTAELLKMLAIEST